MTISTRNMQNLTSAARSTGLTRVLLISLVNGLVLVLLIVRGGPP